MKVGSLFAEIGFKVDESGLNKFANAMKAFQRTVRDGLKDLKEYARAAREISDAMRNAYMPSEQEARARYRANTRYISSQARRSNASSRYARAEAANIAAQATLANERARLMERQTRVRESNAASRAKQVRMKELGLIGTHTGKYSSGILQMLRGIAGFNIAGMAGGIAGLAGLAHPIVTAITLGIHAVIGAIRWLERSVREGLRVGLEYRNYRSFTGRTTRGVSRLMAASLAASSLTPEDIMKDVRDLESGYWDMWFGGGNPRFWQMMGILPSGNGETDLKNILAGIYSTTGGFNNRGLARSLLRQAGLSEEYIQVVENLVRMNPNATLEQLFNKVHDEIDTLEKGNRTLREYDERMRQIKLKITEAVINSGLLDKLNEFAIVLSKLTNWIIGVLQRLGIIDSGEPQEKKSALGKAWDYFNYYTNPILGGQRLANSIDTGDWGPDSLKRTILGTRDVTTNINAPVTNNVTVSSVDEAVDYTNKSQSSVSSRWWSASQNNDAYVNAGSY